MTDARLTRYLACAHGVFGQLAVAGRLWPTVENAATLIPAGTYPLRKGYYDRGGYPTFEVIVEGHDELLVHAANLASELRGCIAPGMELGWLGKRLAVLASRTAHREFMLAMGNEEGTIVIEGPP